MSKSRTDMLLEALLNGETPPFEPQSRVERYLCSLCSKSIGGASSWNDLKDKPFGEEQAFEPIVWDGNTEGLEFCGVNASAEGVTQMVGYCKVSDMFIPYDEISMKTICSDYVYSNFEGQIVENASETSFEDRKSDFSKEGEGWWFDPGNGGQIVMSDGTFVFGKGESYEVTLSRGLWFQKSEVQMGEQVHKAYATAMLPDVIIKPMDEKYLPTLTSPSGKKFKLSVDDSGVLSATEV